MAWLRDPARADEPPLDVVFVDPPYEDAAALRRRARGGRAARRPDGRVVAKHFWRDAPPARVGLLASERERRFGETALTFYRRVDGGRMSVAVYPGSFDPITNGHLDIVGRAVAVFERVVIGVLANPRKSPLLTVDERIAVIEAALARCRHDRRPQPTGSRSRASTA